MNTYLSITYTRKGVWLSKKMWLSAVLLLTMVLTLDSSWSLYIGPLWPTKYWKNTTACLQYKPQTAWATKLLKLLNKYLQIVTFENDKNYSIQFKILNNGPPNIWFNLIWNEKNAIQTALIQRPFFAINYQSINQSIKTDLYSAVCRKRIRGARWQRRWSKQCQTVPSLTYGQKYREQFTGSTVKWERVTNSRGANTKGFSYVCSLMDILNFRCLKAGLNDFFSFWHCETNY